MKRIVTLLLFLAPVALLAQDKKKRKKETLTPQQIATNYLHDVQIEKGFDTMYVSACGMAGKEDGYPELTKEFNVNVTKNAGGASNFDRYCAGIKDTLIAISHRYMELLLNTTGREFKYQLEKRKYVETRSTFALEYGYKEGEKKGAYFSSDIYSPGRPW